MRVRTRSLSHSETFRGATLRARMKLRLWTRHRTHLRKQSPGASTAGDPIPTPSPPLPGEYLVAVPTDMAAKAALVLAFRDSGFTPLALAERLGTDEETVRRMLDPRHDTASGDIGKALRILGSELVVEMRELVSA